MSFKFSFKSIEIGRLSQFERKVIPNGWRCDAKGTLRCNRLSSWYLKGRTQRCRISTLDVADSREQDHTDTVEPTSGDN